ncbi:CDP-diacylglycerol--glycerol-3-phosphate 3-phosphatidyltransferase, partial [gut metagenome]
MARKRGEVTDFGKFLDPIADKLLVFSALLILLEHDLINVWFVFIILFREFLVSALRMVASANGEVIAADKLGKAKTAVTMVSLCAYLLAIALEFMALPQLGAPTRSSASSPRSPCSPPWCSRSSRARSTSGTPATSSSASDAVCPGPARFRA